MEGQVTEPPPRRPGCSPRGAAITESANRSHQLDRALADLLGQVPEIEAASVVSFDGLPMASRLPAALDEDRVAAMSAALLSLGERASEGLGRGTLNQVYIEGEHGTVFLVSADDEAVLVAVAAKGAKVGMMLFEVRRAAAVVAGVLRAADVVEAAVAAVSAPVDPAPVAAPPAAALPAGLPGDPVTAEPVVPAYDFGTGSVEPLPAYSPTADPQAWA
jgi:predicted regulator of Ras-like GTPase activity (Roadblock/LC7/MglB family)